MIFCSSAFLPCESPPAFHWSIVKLSVSCRWYRPVDVPTRRSERGTLVTPENLSKGAICHYIGQMYNRFLNGHQFFICYGGYITHSREPPVRVEGRTCRWSMDPRT